MAPVHAQGVNLGGVAAPARTQRVPTLQQVVGITLDQRQFVDHRNTLRHSPIRVENDFVDFAAGRGRLPIATAYDDLHAQRWLVGVVIFQALAGDIDPHVAVAKASRGLTPAFQIKAQCIDHVSPAAIQRSQR